MSDQEVPTFNAAEQAATALGPDGKPVAREAGVFDDAWKKLSELGDLNAPPKARRILLQQGEHDVLPMGKCGLLAASGGTGKTMALAQLALAVALEPGANKSEWLETFQVATPGHVLLALAEEDADEVVRRLYRAANAMRLSQEQRKQVAERITVLPLAGRPVALTESDGRGNVTEAPALAELRRRLSEAGHDWSLVALDPLSRWAGADTEKDNAAATRFVQAVETLVNAPGSPAVLVAHHSGKFAGKAGEDDARGVSGIRDGFRWVATLTAVNADDNLRGAVLRQKPPTGKSNYTRTFDDVWLTRADDSDKAGALLKANAATMGKLRAAHEKSGEKDEKSPTTTRRASNPGSGKVDPNG